MAQLPQCVGVQAVDWPWSFILVGLIACAAWKLTEELLVTQNQKRLQERYTDGLNEVKVSSCGIHGRTM